MPAMTTTTVGYSSCKATLQPISEKATSPIASSIKKIFFMWSMNRATAMVAKPDRMTR